MNVVVTAGPACEPIDEVRRITNFSTGRLGGGLASHLADAGHRVFCLLGHYATHRGEIRAARIDPFTTAASLAEALRAIAGREKIDAVFHAAAVSDFTVARVEGPDGQPLEGAKIPSRTGEIRIVLEPAPKILPQLRDWFPGALLVGWKYELDGGREPAIARAIAQVRGCRTDLCVLNGRAFGPGFGLCDATALLESQRGHHELFAALLARLAACRTSKRPAGC